MTTPPLPMTMPAPMANDLVARFVKSAFDDLKPVTKEDLTKAQLIKEQKAGIKAAKKQQAEKNRRAKLAKKIN